MLSFKEGTERDSRAGVELSFDYFLFYVDGCFDCRYLCAPGSCLVYTEARKNVSGPPGLESQTVESCQAGSGNQVWVPCKKEYS